MRNRSHPSTDAPRIRAHGMRVSLIMLFVALVPLTGLGVTTWRNVEDAREVQASAARVNAIAAEVVGLTELNGALLDEMVAAAIAGVAEDLGADPALLTDFLGADPTVVLSEAQQRTDQVLASASRPDVTPAIAAARAADSDLGGLLTDYRTIMDGLAVEMGVALEELAVPTAMSDSADGAALSEAARILRLAIDARTAVADDFYSYYATLFDVRDAPAVELAALIAARRTWDASVAGLATYAAARPALAAGVERLQRDPALAALNEAIDALIAEALAEGLPPRGAAVSLDVILPRVDRFTAVYAAARDSSATTAEVLDAAANEVLVAAAAAKRGADANIARAYLVAAILAVATLCVVLLAAGLIIRPLRRLRQAAEALQHEDASPGRVAGPMEVQAAATAIRSAAEHFDLITQQVRALAVGSLDAPVLDRSAPGGLGAAVQTAVGTLRGALAQQDEFRRRLAHEASHDGLTQLPNRNASMAQLARSLARTTRSGAQLAVLFIDVDHFKDINDQHGHQAGDTVLTAVAQRLVTGVREGDYVGRLGGDEFVVVAEPVSGVDEAMSLAERLLARLGEPIDLGTVPVAVAASIGIALTGASDLSPDELLRDADLAVYRAKASGRGRYEICDEDLRNEMAESADLSLALRTAIDEDELVLHYQPIVDTHSNELRAFEALVRWQRPGHDELVPPDAFIGFAERSNLIVDLDRWVIDAVAAQLQRWRARGEYPGIPVAVNLSPRHLGDDQLVEHVLAPLQRRGIDPRSIILEVTESALLDDLAGAAAKLHVLRDAGIRVSIDDFGTGFTSLAHLRSLPIDILKIDRSFTANAAVDAHEASIVKLIIDTGHLLGATVTAEGIETATEASALIDLGSDSLQGFYFARPAAPDRLAPLAVGRA